MNGEIVNVYYDSIIIKNKYKTKTTHVAHFVRKSDYGTEFWHVYFYAKKEL